MSTEHLSHHHIAIKAYEIWQKEGRPFGRENDYWFQAIGQLQGTWQLEPESAQILPVHAALFANGKVVYLVVS